MTSPRRKTLAVYCWSPHIQAEGVNAVLDNLQAAGVSAVSTTVYVAEPTEPGPSARREPPEDGGRGLDRVIDRPLWGKREQFLRVGPSFEHNRSLYDPDGVYEPPQPSDLTAKQGHVVSDFIAEAKRRGMETYIQLSPSGRPPVREGANKERLDLETPRLPDGSAPGERMVNFPPLASPELQSYNAEMVKDVLRNYPQLDGLLLDRMEQSVYSFDDAWVDFGPHAKRFADENGLDFESMRAAAQDAIDGLAQLTNEKLRDLASEARMPHLLGTAHEAPAGLVNHLNLRSAVASSYLAKLRDAADSVRPGVKLVPITFPPPISALTGVDFAAFSASANATMIKFLTMHWPLIVTYWTESITRANPSLDSGLVARAVSLGFEMEDDPSADLSAYFFPGPDDPHRAGTEAHARKIRTAIGLANGMPVLPSVHAYGPLDDVERRWRVAWETGESGMWVNRYGYLSEQKLALLKRVTGH